MLRCAAHRNTVLRVAALYDTVFTCVSTKIHNDRDRYGDVHTRSATTWLELSNVLHTPSTANLAPVVMMLLVMSTANLSH